MPEIESNQGIGDHSFYPQLSACLNCHQTATSFDVAGGQTEVKAALSELRAVLNDLTWLTQSHEAPYEPLTDDQLEDEEFHLDEVYPNGPDSTDLSADEAGALYNYLILARGSAYGVHNPIYTKQLIFDSYFALTGLPPTTLTRP